VPSIPIGVAFQFDESDLSRASEKLPLAKCGTTAEVPHLCAPSAARAVALLLVRHVVRDAHYSHGALPFLLGTEVSWRLLIRRIALPVSQWVVWIINACTYFNNEARNDGLDLRRKLTPFSARPI
jgi:hypothetical protein